MRPMQYLSLRSPLIEMASSGKHYDVKVDPLSLRRLIASCGVERWDQRAGHLADILKKHPVVVSRWVSEAGRPEPLQATGGWLDQTCSGPE